MKPLLLLLLPALAVPLAAQQPAPPSPTAPADAPAVPAPAPVAPAPEGAADSLTETPTAGDSATTPMSDKEETGSMSDMLPGFVDPLTLPSEQGPSPGSLFPAELWPLPPGEEPEAPVELPLAAAVSEGGALSPEVIASSFGETPAPALHDPLGLLPPPEAYALRSLLEQSINSRGGFQFSVVLLGGAQQVPVGIDFEALIRRWYGGGKGALVVYYAGHPERTLAWFSPAARESHREEDLRLVLDLGMREAARFGAPLQQLQRFCFKTAIRLDRLHREGDVSPSDEVPALMAAAQPQSTRSMLWWAFAIGVQAAALGAAAVWWMRRKQLARRGGEIVLLPPQEITARLGGAHSGGHGTLLSFGAVAQAK